MGNVNGPGTAVADECDNTTAAAEDLAAESTTNSTLSVLMSSGALSALKTGWVSSEPHPASPDVSLSSANVSLPIPESTVPESFDDGRILLPVNSPNRPLKDIAIQSENANASESSEDQDEPLSTYAQIVDRLFSFSSVAADDVQRKTPSPSPRAPATVPAKTDMTINHLSATNVGSRPTIDAVQKSSAVSFLSNFMPTSAPANDMKLVPVEGMLSTVATSSSSGGMQNNGHTNDNPTLSSSISNVRLTADIPGAQIIPSVSGVDQQTADAFPESSLILSNETPPSTTDSGTTLADLSLTLPTDDDIVRKVSVSGEGIVLADMEPSSLASQLRHANSNDNDMATILSRYPELSVVPKFTSYVEATNLAAQYPELAHIILSHPLAVKKAGISSDRSKQSPRPNWALAPSGDGTPIHTASRPNWAHAPSDDTPKHRPNWALAPADPPKAPSRRNYIPLPSEDSPAEQSAQVASDPDLRHDDSKHTSDQPNRALANPDPPRQPTLSGNTRDGPKHTPDRPNWALAESSRQPTLSGNAHDGPKHMPDRPNWALAGPDSPRQSSVVNAFNGPQHAPDRPNWAFAGPDPPKQPNPHVTNAFDGPKHTPERPNWALAGSDPPKQRIPDQSERRGRDRERRRGYAGYDAGAAYDDGYRNRANNFADLQSPNNVASTIRIGSYADQQWNSGPHHSVQPPRQSSLVQNNRNHTFIGGTYPSDEKEWFRSDNQADLARQAPVHRKAERTKNDRYQPPVEDSWNVSGARSEHPMNHRYQSYHDTQDPWNVPAPNSDWNTNLDSRAERPSMERHQQDIPWDTTSSQSSSEWIISADNQRSGPEDAHLRFRQSGPDRGVRERPPHDPPPRIPWQTSNAPDARFAFRQVDRARAPIPRRHDKVRDGNAPTGTPYDQHSEQPNNPEWDPQPVPLGPRSDIRDGFTDWNEWTPDQYLAMYDSWKKPEQIQGNITARREPENDQRKDHNWPSKLKPQALSNDDVWNRPPDGAIDDWLGGGTQKSRAIEQPAQHKWDGLRQVAKDGWNNEVTAWSSKPQLEAFQTHDLWNYAPDGNPEDWISATAREDCTPDPNDGFSSANGNLMNLVCGVTSQTITSSTNKNLEDPWSLTTSVDDWLTPSSRRQSEVSQPTMHASASIPIDSPLWSTPPPKDPQIDEWAAKQTAIILESNVMSITPQEHRVANTATNLIETLAPTKDSSPSQNQRGDNVAYFTSSATGTENWIIPGSMPAEAPAPGAHPAHLPLRPMLDRADSLNASAPYQGVDVLAVQSTRVDQDGAGVARGLESGTVAERPRQDTNTEESKEAVAKQPEADTPDKKSATLLKNKFTPEGGKADASTNWRVRDASPSSKYLPPSARRFYSPKRELSISRPGRDSAFQTKRTEQSVECSDYASLLRQTAEAAPDVCTISQQGVATVAAMKAGELFNKGKENIPAANGPVPSSTSGEWTMIGAKPTVATQLVESKNVEKHPNVFSGLSVDVEGPVVQNE